MDQAKAGGEIGMNGEFYQGGQFMPNSKTTIKGATGTSERRKGTGKQEIEPYVWEVPPTATAKAIKTAMTIAMPIWEGRKVVGFKRFEPAIKHYGEMFNGWHIDELIEMYNNGQRWFEPR